MKCSMVELKPKPHLSHSFIHPLASIYKYKSIWFCQKVNLKRGTPMILNLLYDQKWVENIFF